MKNHDENIEGLLKEKFPFIMMALCKKVLCGIKINRDYVVEIIRGDFGIECRYRQFHKVYSDNPKFRGKHIQDAIANINARTYLKIAAENDPHLKKDTNGEKYLKATRKGIGIRSNKGHCTNNKYFGDSD